MGIRNAIRRNVIAEAIMDSEDTDTIDVDNDTLLNQSIHDLYEKSGSTRKKALQHIIDVLSSSLQYEFVENNFTTLLYQCLNVIENGSSKEISLASYVIGLLALTTSSKKNAREILEESIPIIAMSISSDSEPSKVLSLVECLAVITFVGWENSDITEQAMRIMWQVVFPKLGTVQACIPTPPVIIAMISAWSFVLTTMNGWNLSLQDWQESISYLSTLLDMDDRGVRIAAGEALAIIFEVGVGDFNTFSDNEYLLLKELRYVILYQAKVVAMEAGEKGVCRKDLNNQKSFFNDLVAFLKDGYQPETTVKIGGVTMNMSSWTELTRFNFLRRFLGKGFVKHMMVNKLLNGVFDITSKKVYLEIENLSANKKFEKRVYKSQNCKADKKRTQHMNKERKMIKGEICHFAIACGEE